MKKLFSWILALALVLTIMPVLGVHNHAHAECESAWRHNTDHEYKSQADNSDSDLTNTFCSKCGLHWHVWNKSTGKCMGYAAANTPCTKYNPNRDYGTCVNGCDCPHQWDMFSKCTLCTHKKGTPHVHEMKPTDYITPATCMKAGVQTYKCYSCDRDATESRTLPIDPNAHKLVNNKCTNTDDNGVQCTYHECTWSANGGGKCQTVSTCTETHPHTDADFNKVDTDSIVAGTCMTAGSYKKLCEVCGASKTVTGELDPTNHKFVMGKLECQNGCGKECPHENWNGDECSVCGTGHNHPGEPYTSTLKTAATCVKPAVYTYAYACGAVETITGEVDPDAHTWAPTGQCANTGCNQACTHNWADGVCTKCTYTCKHPTTTQTTTVPGNCKNVGSANLICDECGVVTGTVELPVDEDNHDWVVFPFGAGYCNRCGEINVNYDDFEDVLPDEDAPIENPCDEHEWAHLEFGAWYCTKCGASATDIKPLEPEVCDHAETYIEVVTAATCKKEGSAKEICDICEEVVDENVVLPIDKENGHDLVIFPFGASWCNLCSEINVDYEDFIEPEDPTCEHDWAQVGPGWYCWKCNGVTLDEPEEPEVPEEDEEEEEVCEEHQWASLAFGAWYCTKCGASATDIKPLEPEKCDHADTYIDVIDAATCVEEGLGNKVCDICETVLEKDVVLPIDKENGHKYTEDKDGNEYCELCEDPAPEVEPCEHEWAKVATGWYCWKCDSVTLEDPNAEPEYAAGDINMDGVIDGRDEVRLMKYLVGQNVEINLKAADVNGDGTIDGRDEVRLMKMLVA